MVHDLADRRGVLRTPQVGTWSLDRGEPSPALSPFVAWYWAVAWDLEGHRPHRQVTVPHVSSHLVVEGGEASLHGVPRKRFERVLEGRGQVVGARFTAGGLAALLGRPLLDGPIAAAEFPGLDAARLVREIQVEETSKTAFDVLERHLLPLAPPAPDPATELSELAVATARSDRTILRVRDLAAAVGVSVRSLQALFATHVGVSPGWAIRRCRIQEAALVATEGGHVDWAALAADLGYSDQAHLIRDFTATVGTSPARYARDGSSGGS